MSKRLHLEVHIAWAALQTLRQACYGMGEEIARWPSPSNVSQWWEGGGAEAFAFRLFHLKSRIRTLHEQLEQFLYLLEEEIRQWEAMDKDNQPLSKPVLGVSTGSAVTLQLLSYDHKTSAQGPTVPFDVISTMRWNRLFALEEEIQRILGKLPKMEALLKHKQDLERQLEDLSEEIAKLEREKEHLINKLMPSKSLQWGFDDGWLDMPWRTKADEIEDRILQLQSQQEQIRQKLDQIRAQIEQRTLLEEELAHIEKRLNKGIEKDGPTASWLITSKKHGLAGCTNYVARKRDVTPFPDDRGKPGHPGHAYQWDNQAVKAGYEVGIHPVKGSIMVFEQGVLGVNRSAGHVAYVEHVERTDKGFIITTSEADTLRINNQVVRGTHGKPYTRQYYMERLPDGGYRVWRLRHGQKIGNPVEIHKPHRSLSFIYDRPEQKSVA